jgi:uncharacterized protein YcfL
MNKRNFMTRTILIATALFLAAGCSSTPENEESTEVWMEIFSEQQVGSKGAECQSIRMTCDNGVDDDGQVLGEYREWYTKSGRLMCTCDAK